MNQTEFKKTKAKILKLLAADKLEEAISLLFTLLEQHAKKNELLKAIVVKADLERVIRRGDILGMLDWETIRKERQEVIKAIYGILEDLEREDYSGLIERLKTLGLLLAGTGMLTDLLTDKEPKFSFFTDPRDGKTYKTVKLLGQTWMAENLNYEVGEGC